MTQRGGRDLGQHWLKHHVIKLTNVDLSSNLLCGIHLRVISQGLLMNLIHTMGSKITL